MRQGSRCHRDELVIAFPQAVASAIGINPLFSTTAARVIRRRVRAAVDDIVGCCMPVVLRDLPAFVHARLAPFCRASRGLGEECGTSADVAYVIASPTPREQHLLDGLQLCVRYGHRRDVDVLGSCVGVELRRAYSTVLGHASILSPKMLLQRLVRVYHAAVHVSTAYLYAYVVYSVALCVLTGARFAQVSIAALVVISRGRPRFG